MTFVEAEMSQFNDWMIWILSFTVHARLVLEESLKLPAIFFKFRLLVYDTLLCAHPKSSLLNG